MGDGRAENDSGNGTLVCINFFFNNYGIDYTALHQAISS
jgi:hypothetical protein